VSRPLPADAVGELVGLADATLDAIDADRNSVVAWAIVDTADGSISSRGVARRESGDESGDVIDDAAAAFRIASMTKSFTAAAVLSLRDEGRLALDDTLADLVPDLPPVRHPDPEARPITVRMLLSMGAGIVTDDPWADRHLDIGSAELDEALHRGVVFAARPDESYEYSNLGYGLLGRVVRAVTGAEVQALVSERLLAPLGMASTRWLRPAEGAMTPWIRPNGRWEPDPTWLGDGDIAPMGGLWTTIDDLARWVAFLAGDRPGPLSVATRREMQRAHRYVGTKPLGGRAGASCYGFGLRTLDDPRLGLLAGHAGGLPGWGSNMRWHLRSGFGALALANSTYAPMSELTVRMLDVLNDHDVLRPAWPRAVPDVLVEVARRLAALVEHWDDTTAHDLFADNVDPDRPLELRRADLERRRPEGALRAEVHADESDATATVTIRGDAGEPLVVSFDLAPTLPATIQRLTIGS
jgi:CubicO group peptidase (beta-lactamase class C family)